MAKISNFFQKISNKVALALVLIYVTYLGFSFYRSYRLAEGNVNFISKIWSYPLYQNSSFNITLGKIIALVGFLILAFAISQLFVRKIVHKLLDKTSLDIGAKSAIENLSGYLFTLVFVIIALSLADIPLAALTFVGGALAIGFGLGAQGILNNFMSGIILQIEKPIKVGDIVAIDDLRGVVEEIGTRSTKLALSDHSHIIVPNSKILENKVSNWTLRNNILRSKINVELAYQHDPKKVQESFLELLNKQEEILKFPEARVYVDELTPTSIKYTIYYWIRITSTLDKLANESDTRIKIYQLIKEKNYKIPLPTQSLEISADTKEWMNKE